MSESEDWRLAVSVPDDAFDGVDAPRGLFPDELPWTPESGYVVDQPPALIDDALARALAKKRASDPRPAQETPAAE